MQDVSSGLRCVRSVATFSRCFALRLSRSPADPRRDRDNGQEVSTNRCAFCRRSRRCVSRLRLEHPGHGYRAIPQIPSFSPATVRQPRGRHRRVRVSRGRDRQECVMSKKRSSREAEPLDQDADASGRRTRAECSRASASASAPASSGQSRGRRSGPVACDGARSRRRHSRVPRPYTG